MTSDTTSTTKSPIKTSFAKFAFLIRVNLLLSPREIRGPNAVIEKIMRL